jgi:hypothetical protein
LTWEPSVDRTAVASVQILALCAACTTCLGQWTAIRLHPLGSVSSIVNALTPELQGGRTDTGTSTAPSLWAGSSQTWMSLAPNGNGIVFGMSGDQQVGVQYLAGVGHASLWSGTPSSRVDLHPTGAAASTAYAIADGQQVGEMTASAGSGGHAVLWHGSAASLIDLHPQAYRSSRADATDGLLQGGWVQDADFRVTAALWSGSANSYQSLNPAGAMSSEILGMAPGIQVGEVGPSGGGQRAAFWHGTAASYVDMTPPGAGTAMLNGTTPTAQVGAADLFSIGQTAGIWFGTPESFVPLAAYLPPGYSLSTATSVAELNGTYYVGGYALDSNLLPEAFLWIGVPAPSSGLVLVACAGALATTRRRPRH